MKNSKRILSVNIKRMYDEDPDTSWLGDYSTKANSDYSIDRRHTEDCATAIPVNKDAARMIGNARGTVADIQMTIDNTSDSVEWEALEDAYNQLSELEDTINYPECDCGGLHVDRNSCEYFNPNWSNYKGLPEADIRKYCRQDFDRMESLNNQNWYFIGIEALAEIQVTGDNTQEITSGGLWGIESDSDKSHIKQVEEEQLAELRSQLKALGFSTRAVSKAFQNVERKGGIE